MKKTFSLLLLTLIVAVYHTQAQSLTNEYLGCNSFKVTFDGGIPSNLYTISNVANCGGTFRSLAGASIVGSQFQLKKMDGQGNFVTIQTTESGAATRTYSNLQPGIYRVTMIRRMSNGTPVYSILNPCNTPRLGWAHSAGFAEYYTTEDIEIGTPTVSNIIFPAPTGTPASISYAQIDDPGDLLLLNGEGSFGERAYQVAVFKNVTATGVEVAYASSGWVQGKISIFDLKSLNMVYEPGYTYTVQLALSQLPCTGWKDQTKTFRVTSPRETPEESAIVVRPNPVNDQLNIDGLEAWESEKVDVTISDMLGRAVLSTTLTAPFGPIQVADLTPGNYVLILRADDKTLAKKIVIQR